MRQSAIVVTLLLLAAAPAEPAMQGVALYRAEKFAAAAAAFARSADPVAPYDQGCALARAHDWRGALAAFDTALARDPSDADAIANRALMLRLLAGTPEAREEAGHTGAAGTQMVHRDVAAPPTPLDSAGEAGRIGTHRSRAAARSAGMASVAPPRAPAADSGHGDAARAAGSAVAGAGRSAPGGDLAAETKFASPPPLTPQAAREQRQATEQWLATIGDDPRRFLRLRLALEQQRREADGTAAPPSASPW